MCRPRCARGERGASLTEYALGLALVAVVLIGATQWLQSQSKAELGRNTDTAGAPVEVAATPTTNPDFPNPPPPPPAYTGTLSGTCTSGGSCVFLLNPPAPTATWTVSPSQGGTYTGAPPAIQVTKKGSFSVTATIGAVSRTVSFTCDETTGQPKVITGCTQPA